MTTTEAEVAAMSFLDYTANIVVPNVTNMMGLVGFEADVLSVTPSGYASCIELKISKGDLKNDLQKKHIKYLKGDGMFERYGNVHRTLDWFYGKLKYFYYGVPKELIEETERQVPDFCGIINLSTKRVYRSPKKLFNYKWTEKERMELSRLGTMRISTLKRQLIRKDKEIKKLKTS